MSNNRPRIDVCDPALRDHPIVKMLEAALEPGAPFKFSDHLELFESAIRSTLPRDTLKLALANVRENPDYQLPRFVMEGPIRGWTVLTSEEFAISVGVRSAPRPGLQVPARPGGEGPKIQPYPYDIVVGFLAVEEVASELFEVRPGVDESQPPSLRAVGSRTLHAGDSLYMRAGLDASVSRIRGTMVYVEVSGRPMQRVLPRFDPATKAFCGWISGDPMACRIELLTRTLAELGRKEAAPLMADLSREHLDHFVRWNSVRHLLRLDRELGIERTRAALADDHPDVRDAAARTLAILDR